mmetsp:Transcript_117711/g.366721  ORF Transcript_117711/g.366721 Transcript_117711/m.366721 type:complete len:301 (+) Transcript_117711:97-999(+)
MCADVAPAKSRSSVRVDFAPFEETAAWLAGLDLERLRRDFEDNGVLPVPGLLDVTNTEVYASLYRRMLTDEVDTSEHRHDLGSHIEGRSRVGRENVPQVMWPRLYFNAEDGPLHRRALALARALLGPDMALDFDMLIYKGPGEDHPFPWHQDEGYWRMGMKDVTFPDLRATSIWVALDDVDEENGCMWMVPGSHKGECFTHAPLKEGHHTIHTCGDVDPRAEALLDRKRCYPIKAGGAVLNTGRTLHCTGGNHSTRERKAYILNFRPIEMIELERRHGFDHGRKGIGDWRPKKQRLDSTG